MSNSRQPSGPSRPRPVPLSSSPNPRDRSVSVDTSSRATSMARLASPVATPPIQGTPPIRQVPTPNQLGSGSFTPLTESNEPPQPPGPGLSALAQAFHGSLGTSPPRYGTPPIRPLSPSTAGSALQASVPPTTYGSFETSRSGNNGAKRPSGKSEEARIVKRHLVQPPSAANGSTENNQDGQLSRTPQSSIAGPSKAVERGSGIGDDEFSSLQLQGGDMTRDLYKYAEEAESPTHGMKGKRSKSWHGRGPGPESDTQNFNIKQPGGFRRDYLLRNAPTPSPTEDGYPQAPGIGQAGLGQPKRGIITRNFIEFLSIYGHFAGEGLEEDDEDGNLGPDDHDGTASDYEAMETSALLTPGTPGGRRKLLREPGTQGTNTAVGAAGMLLKSFVGTGVLFLPKAYLNGGMHFSNLVLLAVAGLSFWCFILLVNTRTKVDASFGDMGGILYGKWLRTLILSSVALSQVGFVSAYIVFISENLQAFILAVSNCQSYIDIKIMVLMQLVVLLPFSLTRDIAKLGFIAIAADIFIFLGLIVLYYYDIRTLVVNHGVSDIVGFNSKDWTLFIGTAIFTFEGVGLIIPIQESMKEPTKFAPVLGGVMIFITLVFISMGALSYAAFGSATRTVLLLNLPQDDKLVNAVQLIYSLAILLSTPLQLFPAIRIMETELFSRSGKYNPWIKWKKNAFRFFLTFTCALIAWGGAGDLDKFVALVGSFACVPLVYIYPALLHFRGVAETRLARTFDVVLCAFGFVLMAYTTGMTIVTWVGSSSPKAPGYCDQ